MIRCRVALDFYKALCSGASTPWYRLRHVGNPMEDLGSHNQLIVVPAIVFDFRLIISAFWSVRYREMAHERRQCSPP